MQPSFMCFTLQFLHKIIQLCGLKCIFAQVYVYLNIHHMGLNEHPSSYGHQLIIYCRENWNMGGYLYNEKLLRNVRLFLITFYQFSICDQSVD